MLLFNGIEMKQLSSRQQSTNVWVHFAARGRTWHALDQREHMPSVHLDKSSFPTRFVNSLTLYTSFCSRRA